MSTKLRIIGRIPLLALLWILLFLAGVGQLRAAESGRPQLDQEIDLQGVVLDAPAHADGTGTWTIQGQDGGGEDVTYTVLADDATRFQNGVPVEGDRVRVEGVEQDGGTIQAARFIRQGNEGGAGDGLEFKGIVVTVPDDSQGLGEWTVRSGYTRTRTVLVDANTHIKSPIPRPQQWVEVRGTLQADESVLATHIRLDDYEQGEVVVRLAEDVSPQSVAERYGLQVQRTLLSSANIHLFGTAHKDDEVENLAETLADDDQVIWAELNYVGGIPEADPYEVWKWGGQDTDSYANQEAFQQIHLPSVQQRYQGDGVVVAILDTGISLDHPALAGHLLDSWDMVDDDNTPLDEGPGMGWGHGTHVAGIIAHIAPDSRILPVRVLDAQGRGNTFVLAYAIEWAVAQGADVINLSLGTPFDSKVLHETIEQATAQGVVVTAAAGNENDGAPQYPAAYADVIAITALDQDGHKADFANYSDWISIAAPGVGITSTIVGPDGNGYAVWSGTSMATSFVSGVAALGRQKLPDASSDAIRALLVDNTSDIDTLNPDYSGLLGSGLLNAEEALQPVGQSHFLYVPLLVH